VDIFQLFLNKGLVQVTVEERDMLSSFGRNQPGRKQDHRIGLLSEAQQEGKTLLNDMRIIISNTTTDVMSC
jgi:hypothetical protein